MKKKKIMIISIIIAVVLTILVSYGIVKVVNNSKEGDKNISIDKNKNQEVDNKQDEVNSSEYDLYPNEDKMTKISIGTYLYNNERRELCTMEVPINYEIKQGVLRTVNGKENVEGILGELEATGKLSFEDKLLTNFKIGTVGFDYIEPSKTDTILSISVYTDAFKEMENVKDAYELKIDNATIYALRNDSRNKNAVQIYIPIDETLMIYIQYIQGPQIESGSLEAIVGAIAKNVTIIDEKKNNTGGSNNSISTVSKEKLDWSDIFGDGQDKVKVTMKSKEIEEEFLFDVPGNYEMNVNLRKYDGQTAKEYIRESGNIIEKILCEGSEGHLFLRIIRNNSDESWIENQQRKYPEGFSVGTKDNLAWAYEDPLSSGTVIVTYPGNGKYGLEISYYNSRVLKKYGINKVAEGLYNMVTYKKTK